MTAGSHQTDDARRVRRALAAAALLGVVLAAIAYLLMREEAPGTGPTVGEKVAALGAERASLQARADGEARIGLLPAFRAASLLTDALAARSESEAERPFDRLPPVRRRAFAEIDGLNGALREALERPGEGARLAALKVAGRATAELDRLAGLDDVPLVLSFTPRFVSPRRTTGELTLAPGVPGALPRDGALRFEAPSGQSGSRPGAQESPSPASSPAPTVPRYAPDFAASGDQDPPVQVEVVGVHLASAGGPLPVLAVGAWRGEASIAPERLRFAVPRAAFATDALRTTFAAGTLSVRRASRTVTFQLLFTVLPDRPGLFALDQRVRTTTPESNTLVSPEILSRAPVGETRTVRRCFDPPAGWRFDKEKRRVVIVERLGWQDDLSDPTLNAGSVEFVPEEEPGQICIAVIARPVTHLARTATIGRFEATLVRDRPVEQVVKSGVRALDWREAARVPIEPGVAEWKLYVRLFDEIDREFDGPADAAAPPPAAAFLRITRDSDGRTLVLRADPTAEPAVP
ncbi:MAG TPA: hypothetical protein VL049_19785 [Candidatus Dormibacteraeota bacterium]|nr:hypothetical protein [Candidatus Dormibacteraeota bacterium]